MAYEPTARVHAIKKIFQHPDYVRHRHYDRSYDFALIELEKSIEYNDKIAPICVDDSVFPPGTDCYVTGWGETQSKNDYSL